MAEYAIIEFLSNYSVIIVSQIVFSMFIFIFGFLFGFPCNYKIMEYGSMLACQHRILVILDYLLSICSDTLNYVS